MTSGGVIRTWMLAAVFTACGHATPFSNCDVRQLGSTTVADVQLIINQAQGAASPQNDLNGDGVINVVDIQIDLDAALGFGCAADPGIISIQPNTGQQGLSGINVTILGRLTSFTNNSAVSLGAGITVSNVAASNATTLMATLAIDTGAATGARTLTVDAFTLPNAFTVTPPVSVTYAYDSQGRVVTATYTLASGATTVVTYTYDAAGNRTSVVAR